MTRSLVPPPVGDADLNGLVDGHLDPERQAEMLKRLKSDPAVRARVDSWREQKDLIKATFLEVANETIPLSLSLTPPPRLRCVASEGRPRPLPAAGPALAPAPARGRGPRSRRLAFGAVASVVGFFGLWLVLDHPTIAEKPAIAMAGSLAAWTLDALAHPPPGDTTAKRPMARAMPTTAIPDLGDTGFSFTGAAVQPVEPTALVFFYENAAAERLAIGVAKVAPVERIETSSPTAAGRAVTWRRRGKAFALGGTVDALRLNAIAASLQASQDQADGAD